MFRTIKKWYQRAARGWADEDCWSLDWYLCRILPRMIRQLKGCHSYPCGITYEQWQVTLEDMARGFEAGQRLQDHWYHDIGRETDQKVFDKGMILFTFWFFALWD